MLSARAAFPSAETKRSPHGDSRRGADHQEEPLMAERTVLARADRHTYFKTRHRGLSYRNQADGSKRFYGYLPGRGRVQLRATAEREAVGVRRPERQDREGRED